MNSFTSSFYSISNIHVDAPLFLNKTLTGLLELEKKIASQEPINTTSQNLNVMPCGYSGL